MTKLRDLLKPDPSAEDPVVVVRLKRSSWYDHNGFYMKTSLTFLKRKCVGDNWVYEDLRNADADWAFETLVLPPHDGIYQVLMTNVSTDWETGYVDDYDLTLVPYKEDDDGAKR